jgi:sec-independent protein translocase protein TatA
MPFGIGVTELVILLVALLIIFGPKRLPELGQSMGRGIREFKGSLSGDKDKEDPEEKRPELETSQVEANKVEANKPAESVEGEVVTENKA